MIQGRKYGFGKIIYPNGTVAAGYYRRNKRQGEFCTSKVHTISFGKNSRTQGEIEN